MAKKQSRIYFTNALCLPDGAAVLAGHMEAEEDDPTFTRLALLNKGTWGMLGDLPDIVYGLARKPNPSGPRPFLCVMGRDGLFREYVPGGKPIEQQIPKKDVTYLEDLAWVDGSLYCCGGQRQVYRQVGREWTSMDAGIYEEFSGRLRHSLLSIDGFSERRILAVGMHAETWLWDGARWSSLTAPTNVTFNRVKCLPSGDAYICGDGGSLYRLTKMADWIDLSNPDVSKKSFWDMAFFQGNVYVAAETDLLRVDGAALEVVPLGLRRAPYIVALDADENSLWCVGDQNVYEFNGRETTIHICPDNR
jgi:hypothetical protein